MPEAQEDLRPGASRDEIRLAEERLHVRFPDEFVESYMLHDGQGPLGLFILGDYRLHSLLSVVEYHRSFVAAGGEATLIGFADNGGNTTAFIDAGSSETRGRIVELCDGEEDGVWPGLGAFLARIASDFDAGKLHWDEVSGGFSALEDLREDAESAAKAARWNAAFEAGPTLEALKRQPVGTEVELVGLRAPGEARASEHALRIPGGVVHLKGSLRGANTFAPIRVRIRVESRRLLGLLAPVHTIIAWEPFEPAA